MVTEFPKKVKESADDILENIQGYAIRLEKEHNAMSEHLGTGDYRELQVNCFMTDAEFKTRNENKKILQNKLKQFFKEECK